MTVPYNSFRTAPRLGAQELLNLSKPLSVFIEPTNICNYRCTMCPQSLPDYAVSTGYYQRMPADVWRKAVDGLRSWAPLNVIRLYGLGEPLLHPQLPAMLKDLAPFTERLEISTNGSRLAYHAADLVRSGLKYLRVSIYGNTDEEIAAATGGVGVNVETIKAGLWNVYAVRYDEGRTTPWVCCQLVNPLSDVQLFRETFGALCDEVKVEDVHNWTGDRDLVQLGEPAVMKLCCAKPWYELYVRADGSVTCCPADWQGGLVYGNLQNNTLQEIWESAALRKIRELHLAGQRSHLESCRSCTLVDRQSEDMDVLVTKWNQTTT